MLVTATGWMPAQILDGLTWQDVHDLTRYWGAHPPLQWMIQGFLGIKESEPQPIGSGVDFMRSFNGG